MDTDKLKKIADRLLYTAQVNGGTMGHEMHVCATQINEVLANENTSYVKNCHRFNNSEEAQIAFLNERWLTSVDDLKETPFDDWTEEMKSCYAKWLMSPVDPKVSECKLRGEIVRLHDQLKKAKSIVIQLIDDWDDEADRKWNWGRLFEVLDIKRDTAKEERQAEREPTDECCKTEFHPPRGLD